MPTACRSRVLLAITLAALAALGLWTGVQISVAQHDADVRDHTHPSEHDVVLRVREAKRMWEEGLISEDEFLRMRAHLLGLPANGEATVEQVGLLKLYAHVPLFYGPVNAVCLHVNAWSAIGTKKW